MGGISIKKTGKTRAIALVLAASTSLCLAGCGDPKDKDDIQTVYGPPTWYEHKLNADETNSNEYMFVESNVNSEDVYE